MDFSFSEEQTELAGLARRILGDKVTPELLARTEGDTDRFDASTWKALATANLLGISLPPAYDGGGYGLVEQCLVLQEVGRRLAPVPVWASIVMGASPIGEFGSSAQCEAWVRPAVAGTKILTAALAEPLNSDPISPVTTALRDGDGWRLHGVKTAVPAGPLADLIIVPATVGDEVGVFLVEPSAEGAQLARQRTTNRETAGYLELDGCRVGEDAVLGSLAGGRRILEWMVERSTVGLCALQLGVLEEALSETAEYTKVRHQFGRPIATFQAVGHRCADSYIDVEGARLTLWQAVWRLAAGLPASTEVEVAKYWAAEAGHRVAHAAVHLHGGMGVATEHTTHRYFLWAKQIELMLGGATEQLLRVGAALAAGPR